MLSFNIFCFTLLFVFLFITFILHVYDTIFLLLFRYSCLHFPATTFPCPAHPHLPPSILPPLALSMGPLFILVFDLELLYINSQYLYFHKMPLIIMFLQDYFIFMRHHEDVFQPFFLSNRVSDPSSKTHCEVSHSILSVLQKLLLKEILSGVLDKVVLKVWARLDQRL